MANLGFRNLNHWEREGQICTIFLLGGHISLDAIDGETLQQKTNHKGKKQLQDLQRQMGGEKHGIKLWNIGKQIQGAIGNHGARHQTLDLRKFLNDKFQKAVVLQE